MDQGRRRFAAAFMAPSLILYTLLVVVPLVAAFYYGLTDWRLGRDASLIGIDNYIRLLGDREFRTVFLNTALLVAATLLIQVPLGLAFAYILFWMARGFRFFRSVFFLPVLIAPVAIGLMFSILYNGDVGPINRLLETAGLGGLTRSWLSDLSVVLWAVIGPQVWQYIGFFMVILLAAMRGLPGEVLEAAAIDGASRTRILFSHVVPMLRGVLVICMVLGLSSAMRAFDHSWAMTQGGPGIASSYIPTLIYKRAIIDGSIGYGSAMAMILLAVSLVVSIGVRYLGRER